MAFGIPVTDLQSRICGVPRYLLPPGVNYTNLVGVFDLLVCVSRLLHLFYQDACRSMIQSALSNACIPEVMPCMFPQQGWCKSLLWQVVLSSLLAGLSLTQVYVHSLTISSTPVEVRCVILMPQTKHVEKGLFLWPCIQPAWFEIFQMAAVQQQGPKLFL